MVPNGPNRFLSSRGPSWWDSNPAVHACSCPWVTTQRSNENTHIKYNIWAIICSIVICSIELLILLLCKTTAKPIFGSLNFSLQYICLMLWPPMQSNLQIIIGLIRGVGYVCQLLHKFLVPGLIALLWNL